MTGTSDITASGFHGCLPAPLRYLTAHRVLGHAICMNAIHTSLCTVLYWCNVSDVKALQAFLCFLGMDRVWTGLAKQCSA